MLEYYIYNELFFFRKYVNKLNWMKNFVHIFLYSLFTKMKKTLLVSTFVLKFVQSSFRMMFDKFFIFILVLRKLQDFESPIITQRNMHKMGTRIVIGKWYWDVAFDFEMLHDSVALNLLYIQASAEVERGWIPVTEELQRRLNTLKERNTKEEVNFFLLIYSLFWY